MISRLLSINLYIIKRGLCEQNKKVYLLSVKKQMFPEEKVV